VELKVFLTIFAAVFVVELGDITQLATMLFASDEEVNKLAVFAAASMALVVATAIGALAGSLPKTYINQNNVVLHRRHGFILIGAFKLYQA